MAKASPHRFWVAPYSEFKIGIKLLEKDEISDKDFTLKAGSVEFTPDEDKIDNFTLFTIKSNDTGFVEYTIEVEGVAEKLKLMQIVTDSTVFEIDASGGDVPADVATQTWVNSQISGFVTEDWVESQISDFVEEDALTAYAEKTDLTAYATKAETDAGLSAKADKVKQVPITTTYWETTGWNLLSTWEDEETMEEHEAEVPFTKKTSDFIDISQYCDWTVSAQYVSPDYAADKLFISECTNGKSVYAIKQSEGTVVVDAPEYEGQIQSGTDISGWFAFDQSKVPNGSNIEDARWNQGVELSNLATYAYVSENMDGNAPYQLQDLGNMVDVPSSAGRHVATSHSSTTYVEVSAVYSDEISSIPAVSDLADSAYNTAVMVYGQLDSKVGHIAGGAAPEVMNITTYYESEYAQLSVDDPTWEPDPSTLYVILPDQV